jgi:hypothetical protein
MLDLHQIPVPSMNFCVRKVGDELVFLAEAGDQFISLNPVGSFIWEQMNGLHTLQQILDLLCHEYDVPEETARADLEEFVTRLAQDGVLTLQPPTD